ncbi:MAG: hypothetical protein IKM16_02410, partial [Clostridia bacterium]|nr:hypothetical protein [Clostridia bacterium]
MDERIKMILNSPDENGECEAIELELEGLTDEIDARLNEIDDTLFELDEKIDKLTNHADKFDYAIAVASGILTGIIDAVFVGQWDLVEGREWASDKVNKYVESVAKLTGYKGDGVDGAIKHLEKKYGAPSDSVTSFFG